MTTRQFRTLAAVGIVVSCAATLVGVGQPASGEEPGRRPADVPGAGQRLARHFDVRDGSPATMPIAIAGPAGAARQLRAELGVQAVVDIDPLTGTPRQVARLDGFLTGPSAGPAADVALAYVRANRAAFGMDDRALAGLRLRATYTDIGGTTHLSWEQTVDGVAVFGNGLRANVTAAGELVSVQGAPLPSLPAVLPQATLDAGRARMLAVEDVDGTAAPGEPRPAAATGNSQRVAWPNGDTAELTLFRTRPGPRPAWRTFTVSGLAKMFTHLIDAQTGAVLYRQSHVSYEDNPTLVFPNHPGALHGGRQQVVDFVNRGWLPRSATTMSGPYARVWADADASFDAQPDEEVAPVRGQPPRYEFQRFDSSRRCDARHWCSWDPGQPESWRVNREQGVNQAFYFVSNFHDHLLAAPIGFTAAAGNFEAAGGDEVHTAAFFGADLLAEFPYFVNNAFIGVPPDGIPPMMGLFLFHQPGMDGDADPFVPANSADSAEVVYHEYAHGLSGRLVVDASGMPALTGMQSGAMGEGWSDWYAFDYLVGAGLESDTPVDGELLVGAYLTHDEPVVRSGPMDCPVGSVAPSCAGTPDAGPGGYTYGDFGRVLGFPEVHADGEIWAQTLWDLRAALGERVARSVVTRAMELSPVAPSFLDMRNAIVQADLVNHRGRHVGDIWRVFAGRGMGWYAASMDGDDRAPAEDFSLPPPPGSPVASIAGTVIDPVSAAPVPDAVVALAGLYSGFAAVTDAQGRYTIPNVPIGNYPKLFASKPGYERKDVAVDLGASGATVDFALRRNWVMPSGGAEITETNGDEWAIINCGPAQALDGSGYTAWSTDLELADAAVVPQYMVVHLPVAVDLSSIEIDPAAGCGDDSSSGVGPFRVETSTDGTTWALAAHGRFGVDQQGRLNAVDFDPSAGDDVRFVRIAMLGTQVDAAGSQCVPEPTAFGCVYMDVAEFAIFGQPA